MIDPNLRPCSRRGRSGRSSAALAALLLISSATAARPQGDQPLRLTVARAVETALERSHLLGAAAAEVQAAEAGLGEARAAALPSLDVVETFTRTTSPVLVFSAKLGQEAFTAADFDPVRLNDPDPFSNFQTRFTVDQTVWSGGRVKHGIGAARSYREMAVGEHESARQQVIHQAVGAYLAAVVAEHELEAAREAAKTVGAHLELVKSLFESGLVVESDLLQIEVRQSEIREMVIGAESAVAVSRAALNLAMGLDQDTALVLEETPTPAPEKDEEELASLVAESRVRRPDLQAMRARVEAAGEETAAARADRLPSLFVGGAWEGNGETVDGFEGTHWAVTAGVRFRLFDGLATRSRIRRAERLREASARRAALLEEEAALEVRRAYHRLRASRQRLEQARRAVTLAARSLEIVEDRYREGLVTLVELLEAETARTEARSRQVRAEGDLLRAQTTLDLAVGRL